MRVNKIIEIYEQSIRCIAHVNGLKRLLKIDPHVNSFLIMYIIISISM